MRVMTAPAARLTPARTAGSIGWPCEPTISAIALMIAVTAPRTRLAGRPRIMSTSSCFLEQRVQVRHVDHRSVPEMGGLEPRDQIPEVHDGAGVVAEVLQHRCHRCGGVGQLELARDLGAPHRTGR